MKYFLAFFLLLIGALAFSQNQDTEYWRKLGYDAKIKENYVTAIENYKKVLDIDTSDYDAKLALARLCLLNEEYNSSVLFFNDIFQNDSTDVEALNGLGKCHIILDKPDKAAFYFEEAIRFLPDNVQQYFDLAKAYSYDGKLNKAIEVYDDIMKIDDTYSEAWAGIGKMYYWQGKPKSAVSYYKKALALDPTNEEIANEYKNILNELKYKFTATLKPLNETEESYKINALIQKYSIEKRLGNSFNLSVNFLLDYSDRTFTDTIGDTTRWFDNTWIKAGWITNHHAVSGYAEYSNSDEKFTTYGLNWKCNFIIGEFAFKNSLTGGYDYFYYWNRVGGNSISDIFNVTYKKFGFEAGYTYGVVDSALLQDYYTDKYEIYKNPHSSYVFSFSYKLLSKPVVKLALNYSYMNFKYKSPLYYSPYGRKLTGASTSIYYDYKKFYVYGGFSYNIGTEFYYEEETASSANFKKVMMNVNNWAAEAELGYNLYPFSFSLGGSKFYNPYYESTSGYFSIKVLF